MPEAPSGITASSTARHTATVSWTLPDPNIGDTVELAVSSDAEPSWHIETLGGTDEEWYDTGLSDNDETHYKVRYYLNAADQWSDWSEEVDVTAWYSLDTNTTAVTQAINQTVQSPGVLANNVIEYAGCRESITSQSVMGTTDTNTTAVFDYNESSQTIKTNFAYYLCTLRGGVYEYSTSYKGDAGNIFPCIYESKDTDFGDQNPQLTDRNKTVWAIKLHYEDLEEATFTVGISTDGGATWTTVNKTVGSGTERAASTTFHFHVTGQRFKFRIQHGVADETFKLTGMEIEYEDAGEHWDVG